MCTVVFFPELKLKNSLADVKIDYTPMVLETQKVISQKINKFEEGPDSTN